MNDRAQALLRGDGELTPPAAIERWLRLSAEIAPSMRAEVARWRGLATWFTYETWEANVDYVADVVLPARTQFTLDRLAQYGLISSLQAPQLADTSVPAGTVVSVGNPNGRGTVYATFDGSDPRRQGGAVSSRAEAVTTITVNTPTDVTARVWDNGEWSPIITATLTPTVNPNAPVFADLGPVTTVAGFETKLAITAADPNGDPLSFVSVAAPDGIVFDGSTGVFSGIATQPGLHRVLVRASDGANQVATTFDWTVIAHNGPTTVDVILNEYNAVKSSELLDFGGTDATLGRIAGNGGDWFELLVATDGTDMRNWSIEIWDRELGDLALREVMQLTDHPLLSDLAVGTLITIAEGQAEDLSYNPDDGDLTINVRSSTGFASQLVEPAAGNFDSNRHEWRIRLYDDTGTPRSPFMGETDTLASFVNVGGNDVYARCEDPDAGIHPDEADQRDITSSSYGELNDCGDVRQGIGTGTPGDVNCDGTSSLIDARLVARYAIDTVSAANCPLPAPASVHINLRLADTNEDGSVNLIDARNIARCAIGAIAPGCD